VKKILTTILIIVVALVVITLIVVGVFLDRIVEKAIAIYGPQMTQTSVTVEAVHLSLLTGSAKINGLVVGNPKGYTTSQAISLGTIAVGLDPGTVLSDKIVIRSIRLESPEITFEGGLGGNNLSQILDNMNSSGKSSGTPPASSPAQAPATTSSNAPAQPKSEKKFEVDDLLVSGAKVDVMLTGMQGQQTITLPDIHLTDLGKDSDGITAEDLARRVLSTISSTTIGEVAKDATNLGKNAATLKQMGTTEAKQLQSTQLNNTLQNLLKH
jgi:hypothetical protein